MARRKNKYIFRKLTIPIWLLILLLLNAAASGGVLEYYLMNQKMLRYAQELKQTDPQYLVGEAKKKVIPAEGYTTSLGWKDIGKRLVEVGAIDTEKYKEIFTTNTNGREELDILEGYSEKPIAINENNAHFVVNTLWALGLVNKSKVLDEGQMREAGYDPGSFASTAGWTLGNKPVMELYSSQQIIPLTVEQEERVRIIADNVYRPCCGNSTAFPDCNHGMAALGYIELAVASGLSDEQIYKDLLAFNSFWFPTTYVEMAVYFGRQGTAWENVDPKLALSQDYSSAQGAQRIGEQVADVPGIRSQGGSCGA